MTERPSIWVALSNLDFALHHLEVGGFSTRVLDTGGDDPIMILMHGTGGHLEAYARNIGEFAQHFRVVAYDYPGHGYSTHATSDLELKDYVDHLEALVDALGADRVILNGESLGGWLAIKFAAKHPDRVERLVLNTPGGTMATREVMDRIRTLSQDAADNPSEDRVRARLEWLMADSASVTAELVDVRRRIYARSGFAESMRHILCLQDPDIRRRNLVTDEELAAVACPTLVVWTSDDPSGPAAAGMEMAERIPNGRFELVEEAGHWPQWEQPERFNTLVTEFLVSNT